MISLQASNAGAYNGMAMMTDLRKLSNHPTLLRHDFEQEDIEVIAEQLAADRTYKNNKVKYIMDDLTFMSDFEIHELTKAHKVSTCLHSSNLSKQRFLSEHKHILLKRRANFYLWKIYFSRHKATRVEGGRPSSADFLAICHHAERFRRVPAVAGPQVFAS